MHTNLSNKVRSLSHANGFIETLLGTLEVENIPMGQSPGLVNKKTRNATFQHDPLSVFSGEPEGMSAKSFFSNDDQFGDPKSMVTSLQLRILTFLTCWWQICSQLNDSVLATRH